ncbi:hypothetical protein C7M84_003037 [Penaeus vannamei]|uniref:Uncharacterized protein n=1 Tax=Penaeus vannamei TaxID=6689 RepID=A0A3R7P885_PENVA|nr:hypothetical protein C7M84_003037 [Penaeus vannamei]
MRKNDEMHMNIHGNPLVYLSTIPQSRLWGPFARGRDPRSIETRASLRVKDRLFASRTVSSRKKDHHTIPSRQGPSRFKASLQGSRTVSSLQGPSLRFKDRFKDRLSLQGLPSLRFKDYPSLQGRLFASRTILLSRTVSSLQGLSFFQGLQGLVSSLKDYPSLKDRFKVPSFKDRLFASGLSLLVKDRYPSLKDFLFASRTVSSLRSRTILLVKDRSSLKDPSSRTSLRFKEGSSRTVSSLQGLSFVKDVSSLQGLSLSSRTVSSLQGLSLLFKDRLFASRTVSSLQGPSLRFVFASRLQGPSLRFKASIKTIPSLQGPSLRFKDYPFSSRTVSSLQGLSLLFKDRLFASRSLQGPSLRFKDYPFSSRTVSSLQGLSLLFKDRLFASRSSRTVSSLRTIPSRQGPSLRQGENFVFSSPFLFSSLIFLTRFFSFVSLSSPFLRRFRLFRPLSSFSSSPFVLLSSFLLSFRLSFPLLFPFFPPFSFPSFLFSFLFSSSPFLLSFFPLSFRLFPPLLSFFPPLLSSFSSSPFVSFPHPFSFPSFLSFRLLSSSPSVSFPSFPPLLSSPFPPLLSSPFLLFLLSFGLLSSFARCSTGGTSALFLRGLSQFNFNGQRERKITTPRKQGRLDRLFRTSST